ncbi:MAG: TauD/TfdA family dioxygenase [Betaproteobacteria bacterium]|nr:MAG: TauD/TfdA family dioxygenase [Betaproteobacteria bacterium]
MLRVNRLGRTFFAEVVGLDLAKPLDEATFARVKQAHLEHGVLVFRDQRITPAQHIEFSARFGPLQIHPMSQFNLDGAPEILLVSNDTHPDGRPVGIADAGRYWHTDMSYMKEPALGSLLYARAVPAEGGDTLFCDMTAACRDLPDDMRAKLTRLKAVHHFASRWSRESAKYGVRPPQTKEEQDRNPPVEHPMIRTHPETGEPAIYAGGFAVRVQGVPEQESAEILDWVEKWVAQPKYVYRHRWRLHDLVFWDNRRVMHQATEYPVDQRRHMHRTTVKGNAPFGIRGQSPNSSAAKLTELGL